MMVPRRQIISAFTAGTLAIVAIAFGVYIAFGGALPFQHHFEIKALFTNANEIQPRAKVRIAGVDVGEVTDVQHAGDASSPAALVTMRIDDSALPIHTDATAKIRPRLFLEGNFFVDLTPGSPSTGNLKDGGTIPISQTATPVQLDQVLTSLQQNTRANLQTLLDQYSRGLSNGGAAGYNASIPYWYPAYRNGSLVNQASLGTEPHDLSQYVKSAGATAAALDRQPQQLQSLISDFATFAGALSSQHDNLTRAVDELPQTLHAGIPALDALDRAFPPVRALARDALPGVRSSGPMIDASMPFLREARGLFSQAELRGLVADLRPTVPSLAKLNQELVPLYRQVRAAAGCENDVIIPWSHGTLSDPNFPSKGPVYQEGVKWLPGIAGESRSGDANGQWFRVLTGDGTTALMLGNGRFGATPLPILGTNPPAAPGPLPLRPDVPCETQQQPDLRTSAGPAPPQIHIGLDSAAAQTRWNQARDVAVQWLGDEIRQQGLSAVMRVSSNWFSKDQLTQGGLGLLGGAGR